MNFDLKDKILRSVTKPGRYIGGEFGEILKDKNAVKCRFAFAFPDTYETVKLGDVEFTRIVCTTKIQATTMKQVYYLHKEGTYMCNVIVTIPSGYTVEQIEAMFE